MSVDPDDVTPTAIRRTGAAAVVQGVPMQPGNMLNIAYLGGMVLRRAGASMHAKVTSLEVFLPRIFAGVEITADEIPGYGEGGLCMGCKVCTYPKCYSRRLQGLKSPQTEKSPRSSCFEGDFSVFNLCFSAILRQNDPAPDAVHFRRPAQRLIHKRHGFAEGGAGVYVHYIFAVFFSEARRTRGRSLCQPATLWQSPPLRANIFRCARCHRSAEHAGDKTYVNLAEIRSRRRA